MALRAIKLWAKAQGLYSNVLGYLGGFSWAVLVAKACIDMHQSLPEGGFDATHVIRSFFHLFSTWHWPQPVSLVEINPADKYHQQQMDHLATTRNLFSWNPEKYPSDASHVSFFDRELIEQVLNITMLSRSVCSDSSLFLLVNVHECSQMFMNICNQFVISL